MVWNTREQKGILRRRLSLLESAVRKLQNRTADRGFELHLGWDMRRLTDIGLSAEAIENESDYPFFAKAYQDYQSFIQVSNSLTGRKTQDNFLAAFIKNHPASLYDSFKSSRIVIPYEDTDENLPAQLFRRVNEFKDCIEKQEELGIACEDIEEKEAYVEIILSHYYEEVVVEQNKMAVQANQNLRILMK